MNENLEARLEEAIQDSLDEFVDTSNPEAREREAKNIKTLMEARNAIVHTEAELGFKESEQELEEARLKAEKWDKWIKVGITVIEVGAPILSYLFLTHKLMRFEESGHIPSSPVFRMFTREIHPKK